MAKTEQSQASGTYEGVEFFVGNDWWFHVPSLGKEYKSYREMQDAIFASLKSQAAAKRKKLDIPCYSGDGKEITITGIHAGTGYITTKPKTEGRYGRKGNMYPREPWIKEAIAKVGKLESEMSKLLSVLSRFEIEQFSYGFDPGQYAERIETVESTAARLAKKAAATTLEKELGT